MPDIVFVDENDKKLGQAPIEKVYEENRIPRISRVVIQNSKGEYLLQKRSSTIPDYPNCWDQSVAGHVDAGESYLECAIRELEEELGLSGIKLKRVSKYIEETPRRQDGGIQKKFNVVFTGQSDTTPTELDEHEVSEVDWFSYNRIQGLIERQPDKVTQGLVDIFTIIIKS